MKQSEVDAYILAHVDEESNCPCILWTGTKDPNGYGIFRVDGKKIRVHQYILGSIPPKHRILRTCKNLDCINPDHLMIVKRAL